MITEFPREYLSPWVTAKNSVELIMSAYGNGRALPLLPAEAGRASFGEMEICGVVLEQGGLYLFLQLQNVAKDPLHDYRIDGHDVAFVEEAFSRPIVGIWHTHPPTSADKGGSGPRLSATDLDYAPYSLRQFLIFLGVIREFDLDGKEIGAWRTLSAADA